MKSILVIGSTVADVIVELEDPLPLTGQDVHVRNQHLSLGGCALNVYESIRRLDVPCLLASPTGTGIYGDFVRHELEKREIRSVIPPTGEENGCCYCFVEPSGERTFISWHGAEYRFRREWLDGIGLGDIDMVYICGLEIEEKTGIHIVGFLEERLPRENPECRLFFAPGPRLTRISGDLLERIYALSPILHLNGTEAMEASGCPDPIDAAHVLYGKTGAAVIITLGKEGCCYYDGKTCGTVPAVPVKQVNTNGAGDAHIGTLMACLKSGDALPEAIRRANSAAAQVVGTELNKK